MPNSPVINPIRFNNDRKMQQTYSTFPRIRAKAVASPLSLMYNGYNNAPSVTAYSNDNINLSLDNLTQVSRREINFTFLNIN